MKARIRNKKWLLAKSKKKIRLLHKIKVSKERNNKKTIKEENNSPIAIKTRTRTYRIVAPSNLDVINNTNITVDFYKEVIETIRKAGVNSQLFFDLSNIEVISPDAIMYLIAIISNTKRLKMLNINCAGNLPANPNARHEIEKSGFYKYVYTMSVKQTVQPNKNINITGGKACNPKLIGDICDFVNNSFNSSTIFTKSLYSMILELMTNTCQHAYNGMGMMNEYWYLFVEEKNDSICFVFLDTGAGVPNTIYTNFAEKIKSLIITSDASYISSALKGVFRTETGKKHRGKGFPEIYQRVKTNFIKDFVIVSGKGKCLVLDDGEIVEINLRSEFEGSLFSWQIKK